MLKVWLVAPLSDDRLLSWRLAKFPPIPSFVHCVSFVEAELSTPPSLRCWYWSGLCCGREVVEDAEIRFDAVDLRVDGITT